MAFSDYLYLQRCAGAFFITSFFIYNLWRNDGLRPFRLERIRRFELKSLVCLLMTIAFPLEILYDISMVRVVYQEGFMVNPLNNKIITKPAQFWSPSNKEIVNFTLYVADVSMAVQVSILFLLQCFWNYLSNAIIKKSFMSSIEWTAYLIWAFISLLLHPLLQKIFDYNEVLAELIPLFAFCIECLIVSALGIVSHTRFNRLISDHRSVQSHLSNNVVINKLMYFREMNAGLSICLLIGTVSGLAIGLDAITGGTLILYSKLITDTLNSFGVLAEGVVWIILISIFFPSRVYAIDTTSRDNNSGVQMSTINNKSSHGPSLSEGGTLASLGKPLENPVAISTTVKIEIDDSLQDDHIPLHNRGY